ncbi:hypothetical protein [Pseudoduganella sp. OTU4001]|uniref:hypothetical protein n=1 Tax=Pseudoduganella sp. OTU4001 TaxID=3043854 RepID=UPI00313A97CC
METLRESTMRLQRSVDLLHDEVVRLRTYVEDGFEKLRERIDRQSEQFDKKLADERAANERNFKELRASIERVVAEGRAEAAARSAEAKRTRQWLTTIAVSIAIGVAGMIARYFF